MISSTDTMQKLLSEVAQRHDEVCQKLRNVIEHMLHYQKLVYKIKHDITSDKKLNDSEKVAKLVELLANECPHGTENKVSITIVN